MRGSGLGMLPMGSVGMIINLFNAL
jgi:preprotein translocase subunit Sss1